MFCYTIGVIVTTLSTSWFIEELVKYGFHRLQLVYVICAVFGLVLMSISIDFKKGGH